MSDIMMHKMTLKNDETLFYKERPGKDEQKVLILLHNNLFSSSVFEPLMNHIDEKYRIIAPDMRGFGKSSYHKSINRVEDYANDIAIFCEALNISTYNVLGLEFGGLVAMRLAVDYPKHVKRLLLVSSISAAGRPIRKRVMFNLFKSKQLIRSAEDMKAFIKPVELYKSKNQRWFIKQMLNRDIFTVDKPSEKLYEMFIDDVINQQNLADVYIAMSYFNIFSDDNGLVDGEHKAKDINVPVLNLHGDKNQAVPVGVAKFNERAIGRNVETHILNGVSHIPFIDDLKTTTNFIEVFLDRPYQETTQK